ncbi:uncharacterized protein TEOVI_000520000 [Trypanosoma equiperdum]|uniref:Uncharacterized protein n=2 Tax=Trypanozoon TaxID=39700 RepID=Q38B06_TRYB2|nr:hypothetical protein, conserved [Trypanosoma brucei brucei TREU927]EAN78014.1 hypothetical protein, conserved [Trypanosoma brucei brucei TREU927]SCU66441.1 hypothetical protein, conserved [Trypanosoma equiperdum]
MSSSRVTSANHSMESCNTSLQRSGLNMSVGDTRSIVLALQTLQEKIRRLEQDRNHHQDQYEKALQAHEAYKQDMEHQLEQERSHHRRREKELHEMVQRATEEKTRLQSTLEESRKDLGTFRTELEEMLMKECDASKKRESALNSEMERLRHELEEQQKKHRTLLASIEELKAEKEAAIDTNHHLEQAIQELMRRCGTGSVDNSRMTDCDVTRLTNGSCRRNSRKPRRSNAFVGPVRGRLQEARHLVNISGHSAERRRASVGLAGNTRRTYRDPTYSSIQRDARRTSAGRALELGLNNSYHVRPVSRGRAATPVNQSHFDSVEGGLRSGAMKEVYEELQEELKSLHQQYKDTVERAAAEEISPEVVTAALNRISTLMDRKTDQIRLIKEAQRDMANAGVTVTDVPVPRPISSDRRRNPTPVGADKTTQRSLIVNELRSLYSQHR